MCMGGGGSQPAVIYQPNTGAYEAQLAQQRQAMQSVMNNGMMQSQMQLQAAIARQRNEYQRIADMKTQMANDQMAISQQAMRNAQLVGPPPPEETAKSPVVGDEARYGKKAEGKKSLRIGRTATKTGKGAGLNITLGA